MSYEYTRFGDQIQRREEGSTQAWEDCRVEDVPLEFFDQESRTQARREAIRLGGVDPFRQDSPPDGGAIMTKADSRMGAIRMANPVMTAIASELGLSDQELRERLNGATGGTVKRVSEERFDQIAEQLGLTPAEARERFRS